MISCYAWKRKSENVAGDTEQQLAGGKASPDASAATASRGNFCRWLRLVGLTVLRVKEQSFDIDEQFPKQ